MQVVATVRGVGTVRVGGSSRQVAGGLYFHWNNSRFQRNPIVNYCIWKLFSFIKFDSFEAMCDLVCNINVPVFDSQYIAPEKTTKLSEAHRLCSVLVMKKTQNASD